jgi:hypothetical protein
MHLQQESASTYNCSPLWANAARTYLSENHDTSSRRHSLFPLLKLPVFANAEESGPHGGKCAQYKGIPRRANRHGQGLTGDRDLEVYQTMDDMNLEPITTNFWIARDDDEDHMAACSVCCVR